MNKSVELQSTQDSVNLVGEDSDLMVLLIFKVKVDNVYMLSPSSSTKLDKVTDIMKLQENLGPTAKRILLCHAIYGCDTTALFKKGELTTIRKKWELQQRVKPTENTDLIIEAGEEFLLDFYGTNKKCKRYPKHTSTTARQGLNKNFELACLPSTSDAAACHFKRVYFQIRNPIGNTSIPPTRWGWERQNNILKLVTTVKR